MKKPNIKALLINHVEKMVFGLFAFIVLIVLAKTTWGRYAKSPDDLLSDIDKVKTKIESVQNVWIDEGTYKVVDYSDKAKQIFSPIPVGYYEFSTQLFYPLYQKNEPRREPTYEPIQELTAKASLVSLSVQLDSDSQMNADDSKMASTEAAAPVDEGEFSQRNKAPAGATPATAAPAAPTTTPRLGLSLGGPKDDMDFMGGGKGLKALSNAGSLKGGNVTSRGVRVIAVRGIFPLRQQIEDYKKALHVTDSEAAGLVEITDFILERQVATQGDDPWKNSKWEPVNIESALDILKECSDVDPLDPVPLAMKDAVITMNLPLRLLGLWKESATHPRIKNDELKEADMEKESKLLEALDQTAEESNVTEAAKPRRRGLAAIQPDMKALAGQIKNNPASNDLMKKNTGLKGLSLTIGNAMPGQGGPRGGDDIDRLVANTRYLLFRYFDFDVQSGYAYRYRVRLKLRNPNHESTPEQIAGADPEIAKGEERETAWSDISNAEVVDKTINYFLKDVERDPYREEKVKPNASKAVASLAMYDWDTKLGTVIYDVLNMTVFGAFIGDPKDFKDPKRETKVFDPVEGTLTKKKDHRFTSLDVLVDVEPDAEVIPDQHPDLKLPAEKSRGSIRVGLLEEALIATSLGDLKTLDPVSEQSEEEKWNNRMRNERKAAQEEAVATGDKPQSATRRRMGLRRGGMAPAGGGGMSPRHGGGLKALGAARAAAAAPAK